MFTAMTYLEHSSSRATFSARLLVDKKSTEPEPLAEPFDLVETKIVDGQMFSNDQVQSKHNNKPHSVGLYPQKCCVWIRIGKPNYLGCSFLEDSILDN